MAERQFSMGEAVVLRDGEDVKRGTITETDLACPSGAETKRDEPFYRVSFKDGSSSVIAECDLDPTDEPPEA